jgi:predicted phage tail protein
MSVQVTMYGSLQEYQPDISFNVRDIPELMRALFYQIEGFREHLIEASLNSLNFQIVADGSELEEKDLTRPISKSFSIIPISEGSGNIGKIIAGVALVGLAVSGIGAPAAGAAATGLFGTGISATTVGLIGASLALSGFAGLFRSPANDSEDENKKSFVINGSVNSATSQDIVPVVLGCGFKGQGLIVGSTTVSIVIKTTQIINDDDD